MAKLKISKSYGGGVIDANVSPTLVNGYHVGGTGGNTTVGGQQIQPNVFITGGSQLSGNIIAQKGSHKFRVWDGTRVGTCTLVNSGTLAAGQMNILININTITSANLAAANVAPNATTTYVTYSTANIAGPVTPGVGATLFGFTGNAATATITAVNATVGGLANVTVSITGNVAAQTVNITNSAYASRIRNKHVYDFGSDGQLAANIAGGYNPNRYRYHLAPPDSTFVQVASA